MKTIKPLIFLILISSLSLSVYARGFGVGAVGPGVTPGVGGPGHVGAPGLGAPGPGIAPGVGAPGLGVTPGVGIGVPGPGVVNNPVYNGSTVVVPVQDNQPIAPGDVIQERMKAAGYLYTR